MPRVIDIQRRHMELGRIRLGEKGSKGQPTRLGTWRLTSASRSLMDSAAAVYGGTVTEWTDAPDKGYWQLTTDTDTLDVIVPPGDPYTQFYEMWSGGGCKRRCTGEIELLTDTACKCDPDERECKITTRINVMLPQVAGLGVWRLESHGYYAAAELPDALDVLQQISGGRMVSGLLRIEQRSRKKDGRTNRYPVPVLDLPNVTLASLVGNQVVVNPPPALERGRPPMLNGGDLPSETQFRENETPGFGARPALPDLSASDSSSSDDAPRTKGEAMDRYTHALKESGKSFADGNALFKRHGLDRASASIEDIMRIVAELQPSSGVPTAPAESEGAASRSAASSPTTPDDDRASAVGSATARDSESDGASPLTTRSESAPADSVEADDPAEQSRISQTAAGSGSSPMSSSPVASFTDPSSLETYAAAVLGFDEHQPLKALSVADFEEVWQSLGVLEIEAYSRWYNALERPIRQALMAASQSPRHRKDAAKGMTTSKPSGRQPRPDAETLRMGLDGGT